MNLEDSFRVVFREIFDIETDMTLDEAAKVFGDRIVFPSPRKTVNGNTVYSIIEADKYISANDMMSVDLEPKEEIKSIKDVKKLYSGVCSVIGSKAINSSDYEKSDSILGSSNIYMSFNILSSKYIAFSNNLTGCEYVFGSRLCDDSSFCIRCYDSKLLNNCFEVSWSAKCSDSLFCHNCYGLRHCMFCFHLASKEYCIANRQYTKEEYFRIKKMVVGHLLKNDFKLDFYLEF
jgi:hypothetical protein